MSVIAVLGLGEAGQLYAKGLAQAGAVVRGYDPFVDADGIDQVDSLGAVLDTADVVISLVGAGACLKVAEDVIPLLPQSALYADFNTAGPGVKAQLAAVASEHGVGIVDVAVMAPVPRAGSKTPLLASGESAAEFARVFRALEAPVEIVAGPVGAAAGRKLLRSVFMKGLAGLVLECEAAGEAASCSDWLLAEIATELGPQGGELVERLLVGSRRHAERRRHEVEDALKFLSELGTESWMTQGTLKWISALAPGANAHT
ncbi:DUF1932 domain-containing protein [Arthrobacter sp. zg-Y826]|uniref:DUF1932 domain-containing protein n=1 Tax=Arthrobacter jinronghuae TaxID=2964609 RepID=UPI0021067E97|nr:DUF1932 domain-containing protein [Arthrobacter jinronghuae]MCQ1957411.1 DUF1932 domain-containing protein [Arthrobacter jinronghuae]